MHSVPASVAAVAAGAGAAAAASGKREGAPCSPAAANNKTTCSRLLLPLPPQLPLRRGPAGNIVLRGRAAISAVPGLVLVGLGAR